MRAPAEVLLVARWIRADFAVQTAKWTAADRLTKAGVRAAGNYVDWSKWMEYRSKWTEYHGAFDDWLSAQKPGYELRPGFDSYVHPFYAWLDIREQHAAYRVQGYPMSEPTWRADRARFLP